MTAEARVASDLLVAAIEAIYDSAGRPSNWPRALETVANVFGDVGVNLIWGRDNGSFGVIGSPRLLSSAELRDTWQHADIRSLRAFERSFFTSQDALVVTDHHLLTRQEIAEHPFYTQFLAPRGLCWVAGAMVSLDPLIELSINRARTKPPFSDEELSSTLRIFDLGFT